VAIDELRKTWTSARSLTIGTSPYVLYANSEDQSFALEFRTLNADGLRYTMSMGVALGGRDPEGVAEGVYHWILYGDDHTSVEVD